MGSSPSNTRTFTTPQQQPVVANNNNSNTTSPNIAYSATSSTNSMLSHTDEEEEERDETVRNQLAGLTITSVSHVSQPPSTNNRTSFQVTFNNNLVETTYRHYDNPKLVLKQELHGTTLKISFSTDFKLTTPNEFNSKDYAIIYKFKKTGLYVYKYDSEVVHDLSDNRCLVIPVTFTINGNELHANVVFELNARRYVQAELVFHKKLGNLYWAYVTEQSFETNVSSLNLCFDQTVSTTHHSSFVIADNLVELYGMTKDNQKVVNFALDEHEIFSLTSQSYNQMICPIYYQVTNNGKILLHAFEENNINVKLNEGTIIVPIILERNNQRINIDFLLELIHSQTGMLMVNPNMEPTASSNKCSEYFSIEKPSTLEYVTIEEDSLFNDVRSAKTKNEMFSFQIIFVIDCVKE